MQKIIFAISLHKIYSESSCERFTVTNIYWYGKRLANAKKRTWRLQKSLHGTCLSPAFLCHRKLGQTRTTQTIPALFAAFVFRLSCGRRGVGANYYYNCASFIREICPGKETGPGKIILPSVGPLSENWSLPLLSLCPGQICKVNTDRAFVRPQWFPEFLSPRPNWPSSRHLLPLLFGQREGGENWDRRDNELATQKAVCAYAACIINSSKTSVSILCSCWSQPYWKDSSAWKIWVYEPMGF